MGNCLDQRQLSQREIDYEAEKQRVENTVISLQHKFLRASDDPDELLKSARQSNLEVMHLTLPPSHERFITVSRYYARSEQAASETLEALDLNFYYSLGLPDYQFQPVPAVLQNEYLAVDTVEKKDKFGVQYRGEWKNGLLHGNGILTSNTAKYIGKFYNGLKHIHGREILKREVYEGQFNHDIRKGRGIRYTSDATENGEFDGHLIKGRIDYKNGDKYEGSLKNHKYEGDNCTLIVVGTGLTYTQAKFVDGKLIRSRIEYPNGNVYVGEMLNGFKNGKGKFTWTDSSYYDGQYANDLKHGKGWLKLKDQEVKEAVFRNGRLEDESDLYQEEPSFSQLPREWK